MTKETKSIGINSSVSAYQFNYIVFIGRFQPFHDGHLGILNRALSVSERVIVILGSADRPRTIKDPWTVQEREVMIRRVMSSAQSERVDFISVKDQLYNDQKWVASIQQAVAALILANTPSQKHEANSIGIIGHVKDDSSFYLNMFPQWKLLEVDNETDLNATNIRASYFNGNADKPNTGLPDAVAGYLTEFADTEAYQGLQDEYAFIQTYRAGWEKAPYAPVFVTVDAVLVHSGHVLLVRRKAAPGKGLWALPGGFLNQAETIQDAVVRELREETRIKLPEPVLRGSIKDQAVFDHPARSLRGRTVTHAFYFEFPYGELPKVRGADDADKARWVPIAKLYEMESMLFEDHIDIISFFLGGH